MSGAQQQIWILQSQQRRYPTTSSPPTEKKPCPNPSQNRSQNHPRVATNCALLAACGAGENSVFLMWMACAPPVTGFAKPCSIGWRRIFKALTVWICLPVPVPWGWRHCRVVPRAACWLNAIAAPLLSSTPTLSYSRQMVGKYCRWMHWGI